MIKRWDVALIAILLCLSLIPEVIFTVSRPGNSANTIAIIQVNGAEYKTIPLSEHKGTESFTIQSGNDYNVIVVQDQQIGITESNCPDKICVQTGFISQPGATTICLPHRVMIEIRSADSSEPDIIPAR